MEEVVGKWWDDWIRKQARTGYADAEVSLDTVRHHLAVAFRAFGGDQQLRIAEAAPITVNCYRNWRQKLAGIGNRFTLAYQDGEVLALPGSIDWMPNSEHNRFAYLWLCLLSTVGQSADDYVEDMLARTNQVLRHWPGLTGRYQAMVRAYCDVRLKQTLPPGLIEKENTLAQQLLSPELPCQLRESALAYPVQIWPRRTASEADEAETDGRLPADDKGSGNRAQTNESSKKRRKGKRVARPNDKHGIMLYRFETIFSRAEYASLSRGQDEEQDENLEAIADDLDEIAVTQTEAGSGRLKMDLDLPAEQAHGLHQKDGILLPEWDYRKQQLIDRQVRLVETIADAVTEHSIDELRPIFAKVNRQLRAFIPENIKLRNQQDGEEIDLVAWQDFYAESYAHRIAAPKLYIRQRRTHRDLATFVLADLSLSTDTWIDSERRVIDTLKQSLIVLDEALTKLGDPHAFAGFWSKRNELVNFIRIKDFDSRTSSLPRILSLQPGYYTRLGAAIRHASQLLLKREEKRRLLLVLTDGKPNDLDQYEGRYGIEDTRQAILEARRKGLHVFCVTIDKEAEDYLPYLFGRSDYALIQRPEQLPEVLPRLYLTMTKD